MAIPVLTFTYGTDKTTKKPSTSTPGFEMRCQRCGAGAGEIEILADDDYMVLIHCTRCNNAVHRAVNVKKLTACKC